MIHMVGKPRISASFWHQAIKIWSILQAVRISVTDPDRLLNASWHCVLPKIILKCQQCGYSNVKPSCMKLHSFTHNGQKDLKCNLWDHVCALVGNMKRHMLTHSKKIQGFHCNQCDYSCYEYSQLKRHTFKHSGEKPFRCDQCEYTSSDSKYLKIHKIRHRGEKKFTCNQCEFSSTSAGGVKTHILTHSREKSFKCNECDRYFYSASSIRY